MPCAPCADGGEGNDRRLAREYIEDFATGAFYRLNDPGLFRRIAKRFARKQVRQQPTARSPALTAGRSDYYWQAGIG